MDSLGHDVTIMARKAPAAPGLASLPFVQGDYVNDSFTDGQLQGFDALVFAAAADIRYVPVDGSMTEQEFYTRVNDEAVPRFLQAAKEAGIKRVAYIGTFYPQIAPHRIGICPYVTSRHNTDEAVRAMSTDDFNVCSLNAPFILGHIEGLDTPHIGALVAYAKEQLPGLPLFAPIGGTNHMTSRAVAQATLAALENGESGKAYLLGDENLSWQEYLELWFEAVGNPQQLEVTADDHPIIPNIIMFAGVGATVSYTPEESPLPGYERGQLRQVIKDIVANATLAEYASKQ
jgi:dihydroflavonol-4-reductase